MKPFTQIDALRFWFEDYETITLAQAKAGLPPPEPGYPRIHIQRVAPLIHQLRNEGWVIVTGTNDAGEAYYRCVTKPGIPAPKSPERVTKVKADEPTKADPKWECSKPGCLSGVRPDVTTAFDSRYTTGKCFTHGKVVLVRR